MVRNCSSTNPNRTRTRTLTRTLIRTLTRTLTLTRTRTRTRTRCDENCIPSAWGGLGQGACGESKGDFGTVGCECKKVSIPDCNPNSTPNPHPNRNPIRNPNPNPNPDPNPYPNLNPNQGVEPVYKKTGLPVPGYEEALQDEEQQAAEADALTAPVQTTPVPVVPVVPVVPEVPVVPVVPDVPVEPAAVPAEEPATVPAAEPAMPAVPESKCESANSDLTPDEKKMWSSWCGDQCGPPNGNPENCKTLEQTGAAQCTCEK
jgi:hypothetical protein